MARKNKHQALHLTQIHIRACLQKTTYNSRYIAEQEGVRFGLTAYKCPNCSAFHLASRTRPIRQESYCMLKRITQLTIIAFLVCSLPIPVEARSSSSSSPSSSTRSSSPSSSSSFKSAPPSSSRDSTSYSRSNSSSAQKSAPNSSSSSNSSSTFGSSYNSSYSSRPVEKPAQAVTKTKPSTTATTYLPSYTLPITNTTGKTETRYVTIFSESGNRTVPVIVPFGYTAPIVLPSTYYPTTTVATDGSSILGSIFGAIFVVFICVFFIILVRSIFF